MSENEMIALVDLDGTVVNYDEKMEEDLAAIRSPGEPETYDRFNPPEYIENRKLFIQRQKGWFRNLKPYPPGFLILQALREFKFHIHILTKGPRRTPGAWSEKVEWCQEHLEPDDGVNVVSDKGLFYGKVLVDDWPPYILRWLEWRPRGLVIVPAHPWNEMIRGAKPNILHFDGTNVAEVKKALLQTVEQGSYISRTNSGI